MIKTENLNVSIGDVNILNNIDIEIQKGEIHAVMGPNGSGKSTLCHAIMGNPIFDVQGEIFLNNEIISDSEQDERAKKGLFQSFQYPIGLPGVTLREFVSYMNDKITSEEVEKLAEDYGVSEFLSRDVNIDLSGGEKKRSELFQLAIRNPKGILLDEIDSGLDIDAIKLVSSLISSLSNNDNAIMIVTHYSRILKYLEISKVHIIVDGKIITSGDSEIIQKIDSNGYAQFQEA
jgi:Fe-S cluster assembly ATP-binding protein